MKWGAERNTKQLQLAQLHIYFCITYLPLIPAFSYHTLFSITSTQGDFKNEHKMAEEELEFLGIIRYGKMWWWTNSFSMWAQGSHWWEKSLNFHFHLFFFFWGGGFRPQRFKGESREKYRTLSPLQISFQEKMTRHRGPVPPPLFQALLLLG